MSTTIPQKLYDEITKLLDQSDLGRESSHAINTLNWVLTIKPDASLALQVAALGHDIERGVPPRYKSEDFENHKDYKRAHSDRGAGILKAILERHNLEKQIIDEAVELVRLHEVGGTEDANVLQDADSISFFDNNLEFYVGYKGMENAKKQIDYKFSRCSTRAQSYIKNINVYKEFQKFIETNDSVITKEDLIFQIKQIVAEANAVLQTETELGELPVNYTCIFGRNYGHYFQLLSAVSNLGSHIKETASGPIYKIDPIQTDAGILKLLKIRRPDPNMKSLGYADFTISNYPDFKKSVEKDDRFSLFSREDYEVMGFKGKDENKAGVFFANPPLDIQLGI